MTCQNTFHLMFDSSQTTVFVHTYPKWWRCGSLTEGPNDSVQQWEETWQMQFHPQKCNVIHVTNKRKPITHSYKLHDHILKVMENSKYLGVTINNKLNWTQHITNIKGKASRTLGFLQRNLRGCKSNVKSTAYTTMVRPTLEYAGTVWDPHHQITRGGPAKSRQIC
jgi:hypothetical protein